MLPVLPELVLTAGAMVLLMLGAYRGGRDDPPGHRRWRYSSWSDRRAGLMLPAGKLMTFGGSFIVDDLPVS